MSIISEAWERAKVTEKSGLRSIDNSHVLKGETAVIEKIEGVKLIVKRKDD